MIMSRVFQETVKAHACRPLRLRACEVEELVMTKEVILRDRNRR